MKSIEQEALKARYQAFIYTPNLFKVSPIEGVSLFETTSIPSIEIESPPNEPWVVFGKQMERFLETYLRLNSNYSILDHQVQLIENGVTQGELDFIIKEGDYKYKHLELVCKFYLYNPKAPGNFLEKWIGPNDSDKLVYKINKLQHKQLPIINSALGIQKLEELNIDRKDLKQSLCFKAQLFTPFDTDIDFSELNSDCLAGRYTSFSEIDNYLDPQMFYYIPKKEDWLLKTDTGLEWISYSEFKAELHGWMLKNRSMLCWQKSTQNSFNRFFVTWW